MFKALTSFLDRCAQIFSFDHFMKIIQQSFSCQSENLSQISTLLTIQKVNNNIYSDKKMRSQQQIVSIITNLKAHVDCLMIRMQSCQQSIQRLFKIISEVSSNCNQKISSLDQITYINPNSPDRREKDMIVQKSNRKDKKSMPQMGDMRNLMENSRAKKIQSAKHTSIRDFLLLSSNKELNRKQSETGSFNIFKQAILGNMNQLESLSSSFLNFRHALEQKLSKSNSAIQILTRVTSLMQQKIDYIMVEKKSREKPKARRNRSKDIGLGKYRYHQGQAYMGFQIGKTPRQSESLGKYISI